MDLDRHRDLQDRSVHRSSLETTGFSSDHRGMDTTTRRYRFTITVDVKPDHPAYDGPRVGRRRRMGLANQRIRPPVHV